MRTWPELRIEFDGPAEFVIDTIRDIIRPA